MPLIGDAKRAYMRRRYRENPEPQIAYAKEYDRKRRKLSPESYRQIQYKRRYGMTVEQVNEMIAAQNGCCAICREAFKPIKKKLAIHVDHCHDTMKVRGILCARCNVGLGLFGDDPDRMRQAIEYLEK